MPKRLTKQRSSLVQFSKVTKDLIYRVVSVDKQLDIAIIGVYNTLNLAKEVAITRTTDNQFCVVYGDDNRIVYSTER